MEFVHCKASEYMYELAYAGGLERAFSGTFHDFQGLASGRYHNTSRPAATRLLLIGPLTAAIQYRTRLTDVPARLPRHTRAEPKTSP